MEFQIYGSLEYPHSTINQLQYKYALNRVNLSQSNTGKFWQKLIKIDDGKSEGYFLCILDDPRMLFVVEPRLTS